MGKTNNSTKQALEEAVRHLENELGEAVQYLGTGRLVAAGGLGTVPLGSWGLVALTATRVTFRHFAQAHPLLGGRDAEVRFEVPRLRFTSCQIRREGFWSRWFSGTPDHVALGGEGVWLNVELADDLARFGRAWSQPSP